MTPLSILLVAIFLGTGNRVPTKSFTGDFFCNSCLDVREVKTESIRALPRYFGMKFLSLEIW